MIKVELHITCNSITKKEIPSFEEFCHSINAKPIIILLSKGENKQQPMISKVIVNRDRDTLKKQIE